MDARDHRLRQAHQRQHHAGALAEDGRDRLPIRGGAQLLEVVAGREGGTGGGQDYHAQRAVAGDVGQRRFERGHQLGRERVPPIGAVERERRHPVRVVAQKDGRLDGFGFDRRHEFPRADDSPWIGPVPVRRLCVDSAPHCDILRRSARQSNSREP